MPTSEELLDALEQCQEMPSNFDTCLRIMVFDYILKNVKKESIENGIVPESENESEFRKIAKTTDPEHLFNTMDDLVGCVQVLDSRLYQSFLVKLQEGRE
jgi:hypothetical protein